MIQIYGPENTDYTNNGDITLLPTSCELACEINGAWELTMNHPLDAEERWKHIAEEAVIACPTFQGEKQLFRVDRCKKTENAVEATAYPIFFDAADDCFLMDVRPTNQNGQGALDAMTAGSKYSGQSDITTIGTAYFVRRNLMDAINGENSPNFVGVWGGEMLFDNFTVIINKRLGGDYGADIRYGKNMNGLTSTVDMSNVVTRIIPVAYNGRMMSGDAPWVDSENINKYAKKYIQEVKFEDVKLAEDVESQQEGDIICQTQEELDAALEQKCKDMYAEGADLPAVTIEVNMIDLEHTEQYKDFTGLVKVALGDTVRCYNSRLDITTEARVIALKWDCIRNQSAGLTLGDYEYNYFQEMTSTMQAVSQIIGPGNTVVAERVSGVLNAINTQLRYQKNAAQKQDVRAILFEDTDPASPTYGAMCIGTQGFQIADSRTTDGRDWNWKTAFTAKGGYADVIIAGFMLADRIHGGMLTLGGQGNGNGVCRVLDTNENVVAELNSDGVNIKKGGISVEAGDLGYKALNISYNPEMPGTINQNVRVFADPTGFTARTHGEFANGTEGIFETAITGSALYMASFSGGTVDGPDYTTRYPALSISMIEMKKIQIVITGNVSIGGNLTVFNGTKNRAAKTENYGTRLLNAYETAVPYFGDIGTGEISPNGIGIVEIDPIFSETVSLDNYVVFLQAEGPGECYIGEKSRERFAVFGTPGLRFAYEIKAKQKGFENVRLDKYKEEKA